MKEKNGIKNVSRAENKKMFKLILVSPFCLLNGVKFFVPYTVYVQNLLKRQTSVCSVQFDEASAAMHAVFMQRIAVWRQKEDGL